MVKILVRKKGQEMMRAMAEAGLWARGRVEDAGVILRIS